MPASASFRRSSRTNRRSIATAGSLAAIERLEDRALLAATPVLLGDLNGDRTRGSEPKEFVNIGSTVFFIANSTGGQRHLWKTDGTAAGTVQVTSDLVRPNLSYPGLTAAGSMLYFVSQRTSTTPMELWKSDGTTAGTVKVAALEPPPGSGGPFFPTIRTEVVAIGSTVYFLATDAAGGTELWRTDGTTTGTSRVADINAGNASSLPRELTVVGSTLFFSASSNPAGYRELWKSDGTDAGTVLVKELRSTGNANPVELTALGSTLFFRAIGDSVGTRLWKSDGTADGTVPVTNAASGPSYPTSLTAWGSELYYFDSGDTLWKSDGTVAGTVLVSDFFDSATVGAVPRDLTVVGDRLYFTVDEGKRRLWTSDGTDAGTVRAGTLASGEYVANPTKLTAVGTHLFFQENTSSGSTICSVDSLTGETVRLAAFAPQNDSPDVFQSVIAAIGTTAVFAGYDFFTGQELWTSNGTAAGTSLLLDLNVQTPDSEPSDWTAAGSVTYFTADSGYGRELWRTDGTSAGTLRITTAGTSESLSYFRELTAIGTTLYFAAFHPTDGYTLWKSDGTSVERFFAPVHISASYYRELTAIDGTLYFAGQSASNGEELWKSDGTTGGTVRVTDLIPGIGGSYPSGLTPIGSTLFFMAVTGPQSQREIWKSDGTAAGTVRVTTWHPDMVPDAPHLLTAAGSLVYFKARSSESGWELWKTDGTAEGTVLVKDIRPGREDSNPEPLLAAGGILYFTADDGVSGRELWRTDGTESGTFRLTDLRPGIENSYLYGLTPLGSIVYFQAVTPDFGSELWRTDGTTSGTYRVTDLNPGAGDSRVHILAAVGPHLYFLANTGTSRTQIWRTDGTSAGTVPIEGPDLTYWGPSFANGGTLFFSGFNGEHGLEPYVLRLNLGPDAVGTGLETAEDTNVSGTVTATDPEGDPLTFEVSVGPRHGTVLVNADGTFTYTPHADYYGEDHFTIGARDTWDNVDLAEVTVTVTPTPDLPVALDDAVTAGEHQPTAGNVLLNDNDPDGPLVVTAVNGGVTFVGTAVTLASGATLTVNADGTFLFTPSPTYLLPRDETTVETFSYTATDTDGNETAATVTVTVVGSDDWLDGRHERKGMWSFGLASDAVSADEGSWDVVDVALAGDGHSVMLLSSDSGELFFRRFQSNGTPLDATHRKIDLGTGFSNYANASLAMAANGRFIVAYSVLNGESGLYEARVSRFAADGTLLAHGPQLGEQSTTAFVTRIAMANDDLYVVGLRVGNSGVSLYLLHPTWSRVRAEIEESGATDFDVAIQPVTGEFALVYRERINGDSIRRTVYDRRGVLLHREQVLARAVPGDVLELPSISINASGDVLYAWRAADPSGTYSQSIHYTIENLYTQPGSTPPSTVVATRPLAGATLTSPDVATARSRDTFLISWSECDGEDQRIAYRPVNLASNPAGEETRYLDPGVAAGDIGRAIVAMNARGDFVITSAGEVTAAAPGRAEFHRFQPFDQLGAFAGGVWTLDLNGNGVVDNHDTRFTYGLAGDLPVTGDWNGDGLTEVGVFRRGIWSLDLNGNRQFDAADRVYTFGLPGDVPLVGDWNGDGRDEIGVFRNGLWYLDSDGSGVFTASDSIHGFGAPGDVPLIGDPDNTGRPMLLVFRDGQWYADANRNGHWDGLGSDTMTIFGAPGDQPLLGNWMSPNVSDRSGRDQLAVKRNGIVYSDFDEDFFYEAGDGQTAFGPAGAVSVRGAWSRVALKNPEVVPQRSEIAIFRDGTWALDANGNGRFDVATDLTVRFGLPGDTPVAGDWDGDGLDEIGVVRNGWWYLDLNGNFTFDASDAAFQYGTAEDRPVVGDWDGDGRDEIGMFRAGVWRLDTNGNRLLDADDPTFTFHGTNPVVGDWNGDGRDEVGTYSGESWILDYDGNRARTIPDQFASFGRTRDQPLVGDWDGDGFTDIGVIRDATWSLDQNGNKDFDALDWVFSYGLAGDIAISGRWGLPV